MNIKEALNWSINELKKKNVSEAERSATLLLMDVLGEDRAYLYSHGESELTVGQLKKFKKYIERRKTHEPVWYIIGKVEFYGREFLVNNDVLTPRPETELLVQEALKAIPNIPASTDSSRQFPISNVIELGTGSGNIIITLVKELTNHEPRTTNFLATDISKDALKVAKKNAKLHGIEKRIKFVQGDLLEPLATSHYPLVNSLLIANLPYIPHEDMDSLQFDVQHHEPRIALDGGKDGLEVYERLIKQMKELNFSGMAFFEIGKDQGKLIKKVVQKHFLEAKVEIKKDLLGIDRIVIISI